MSDTENFKRKQLAVLVRECVEGPTQNFNDFLESISPLDFFEDGSTVLHVICSFGNFEVFKMFVDRYSNFMDELLQIRSKTTQLTPPETAITMGRMGFVEMMHHSHYIPIQFSSHMNDNFSEDGYMEHIKVADEIDLTDSLGIFKHYTVTDICNDTPVKYSFPQKNAEMPTYLDKNKGFEMMGMRWFQPLLFDSEYDGCFIEPSKSVHSTATWSEEFEFLKLSLRAKTNLCVDVYDSLLFDPANNMRPTMYVAISNEEQFYKVREYARSIIPASCTICLVIDCQTRSSFMVNEEMATLTDEIWDNMDIRCALTDPFMSVIAALGDIHGDMVMIGPDYDYDTKEWNSVPSLWVMCKQPFARHFSYSQHDNLYCERHYDMQVHHFFLSDDLLAWESTPETKRYLWGSQTYCPNVIQPGIYFYFNIPNNGGRREGTIGVAVSTLGIRDPTNSYFTTAAHIFDFISKSTNERVIIPIDTPLMIGNNCIIGSYCGMDMNQNIAIIKLCASNCLELSTGIKMSETAAESPIVTEILEFDNLQNPDCFIWDYNIANDTVRYLNKSGGITGVSKGLACSIGAYVHPRFQSSSIGWNKEELRGFLVVKRSPLRETSMIFALHGDSGGPVFIAHKDDNNQTISLIGHVEAAMKDKHACFICVQPFNLTKLHNLFHHIYLSRVARGLETAQGVEPQSQQMLSQVESAMNVTNRYSSGYLSPLANIVDHHE